ncbi:anti-sigma factor [Paenibacillus hemerocallicola]|jgi:anti-sigma factor RsiW|uniref:Anti-sigma-W factor RsiW n=1 Tax=Paenibacillus hemerocallicola TaxID=1172614 RepID=A0A5C4SXF7_9BACL|nr:zf-HC2 domain-containing protein [Paenibacillus hemerocallicola]TNJ59509.1 anti-sigma factor [Paenibacillus hemerocallicola]
MDCKEAILLMHDYLDGDVTGPEAAQLKKHLIGCASCQERYTKLEKAGALVSSLKPVYAPSHMTTSAIMQSLPAPTKRSAWVKWPRRHPAASVAAIFLVVMLGSFLTMWNEDTQLVVHGSDLEQVVIKGNTVVVPEGHTVQGNLIIENGQIEVNGKINGNLVVIDGNYALASTAQISGDITSVNQAVEWIWFKLNQLFSMFVK